MVRKNAIAPSQQVEHTYDEECSTMIYSSLPPTVDGTGHHRRWPVKMPVPTAMGGGNAGTVDSDRCEGRYRRRWVFGMPVPTTVGGGNAGTDDGGGWVVEIGQGCLILQM